jgi:methyl-accepting chemotaxis protein
MKAQMGALETTIDKINNITGVIQKALQEETAATHEIARSAQAASLATDDVTKGLSHMLITTEQIREASRALTDEADALRCDKTQD